MTTAPDSLLGRKFALSFGLTLVSVIYALWQNIGGSPTMTAPAPVTQSQPTATPVSSSQKTKDTQSTSPSTTAPPPVPKPTTTKPAPAVTQTPTPTPTPAPKPVGQYKDGSYTGSAADAYYGTVQVKAVIQGGKISDVQFLQYPNSRSNSIFINNQAMPLLTQEAIQAQSANVSGVSGATFTSEAFIQSLTVALASAKN